LLPGLREARGDRCGSETGGGDEDLATTAEPVVERVDNESATT
jgi:hypothetical protein